MARDPLASVLVTSLRRALDPVAFARSIGFSPDPWQAGALRSESRRILLNCSRQAGKSTVASVMAVHRAVFYERSLVLLVSPSLRQSGELFRKVVEAIHRMPHKPDLGEDSKTSLRFANGSRIVSLPGSEGTIRGFSGAALIIEDEASRVDDDLYRAVRPMLAVSGGTLVLMSTPFGKRGHFHDEWTEGEGWERVQVQATEVPRISPAFLEGERRSLGQWWFAQEYMCEFCETVDAVFSHQDIMGALSDSVQPLFPASESGAASDDVRPLAIGD